VRSLSNTLGRLATMRTAMAQSPAGTPTDRLTDLEAFGANPGALRARTYVPGMLAANAALVVVLHGCTQTAAGYDHGSGWSQLADRHGFALLLPEQQRTNNANLCFNWFSPEDSRRDSGEAQSIRQMISAMIEKHAIDPARVFVTGLSAGGAMTSVMLAAYPEVFAGGAIIAGLPYGIARSVPEAFDRMRGHGVPAEAELAARVRGTSDHTGPWPTVSIWHGTGDATVSHVNAEAAVAQWRGVQGLAAEPSRTATVDGVLRKTWCDDRGGARIEQYSIAGLAHGTPLDTRGPDGCGTSGPYMLECGISSTRHIAAFWGLTEKVPARAASPKAATAAKPVMAPSASKVIEDALRAAGLMR
jgi:poly(hydroxyalkanoate) depolymerase family esterase